MPLEAKCGIILRYPTLEAILRAKAKPKSYRQPRQDLKDNENRTHTLIDNLRKFEDFRDSILPALQADIKNGLTPKQLREKYQSIVQARQITEAITAEDGSKAASAAKDILDRTEGKATEHKTVVHKFDKMSDEELDAVLKSEEEDLEDMQGRFEQ